MDDTIWEIFILIYNLLSILIRRLNLPFKLSKEMLTQYVIIGLPFLTESWFVYHLGVLMLR